MNFDKFDRGVSLTYCTHGCEYKVENIDLKLHLLALHEGPLCLSLPQKTVTFFV
jgi:hypothetical protein